MDDNGINPGTEYELLYYGKNGWRSLGYQVATSQELVFKNVPEGALYWLQNQAEGQEERIFTVEDGIPVFW